MRLKLLTKTKGRLKTVELAPKSWTLIKAYSGALCKLGSVCDRTQLFQFQTATLAVVVIHMVIYLFHQFVHRQFPCVIETLRLQHRKEAFHRRIVPTIRLTRHALNHGMFCKQFPISIAAGGFVRCRSGLRYAVGCVCAGSGVRLGI